VFVFIEKRIEFPFCKIADNLNSQNNGQKITEHENGEKIKTYCRLQAAREDLAWEKEHVLLTILHTWFPF